MGDIANLRNDGYLIDTFTWKFENGNPVIFNKTLYHSSCKELRNQFSPILINTTHKNEHFYNQINGKFQEVV